MADATTSDEEDTGIGIFNEPEGYYEPDKQPTTVKYETSSGREISLRLVGHSPLWGHHLWQASLIISHYLEAHAPTLITNKSILELGAAAGLPSILCALHGARHVVATDYPDADLIENLRFNVQQNCTSTGNVKVEGYLWGADVRDLLTNGDNERSAEGFDVLILADLLFNHSEHGKLISTIQRTLRKGKPSDLSEQQPQALVFFTPYRPWLFEKDMAFFELARESGFDVEKIIEEKVEKVMFEEDRGNEELRRTVFGYRLTWA